MIIVLPLALSVLWVLATVALHVVFFQALPRAPDERTGHTHRLIVNHYGVRFGTQREARTLEFVEEGVDFAALVFVSTSLLGLITGVLRVRDKSSLQLSHPEKR